MLFAQHVLGMMTPGGAITVTSSLASQRAKDKPA
jgi:hypothetical protein